MRRIRDQRQIGTWLICVVLCSVALPGSVKAQSAPFQLPRWSAEKVGLPASRLERLRAFPGPGPSPSSQDSSPCLPTTVAQLKADTVRYGRALPSVPRNMVRPDNLKWEVPVGGTAAILAQWVDVRASNRIRSEPFTTGTDDASNWLIGTQFGAAALTFLTGCASGRDHARQAGFATMEAAAYGALSDLALKAAFNREYPSKVGGDGRFWHGGKSFPSAHAATSWAMAAAMARHYEHKRWVKWASYGAATGVTALRFTARKHFPSDLVIGGALGYLIGTSVGGQK